MSPRIFMTGASGYIGGQFLHTLIMNHPEYTISALTRSAEQKQKLAKIYPTVDFHIGDLDSSDLIIAESKKADVVLQAADCYHTGVLHSIIKGITLEGKKAIILQLSGAGLIYENTTGPGNATPKIWNDTTDLAEIADFDETHTHAIADQFFLSIQETYGIKTALIAPPNVYGSSDGIKNTSITLPWLINAIKARGKAFTVGKGDNYASFVHVQDVADVMVMFVEEALADNRGQVQWGTEGFYWVTGDEVPFKDVVKKIAKEMKEKRIIESTEIVEMKLEEANEIHPFAGVVWGSNMRVDGSRMRALGWEAKHKKVLDSDELLIF